MALLRVNRLDEAERSAREALLRKPNFAQAYLVLSDACGHRHEYREQLQDLDAYLKLEPNGAESEHVRKAREVVLRILAKLHPEDDFAPNKKVPFNTPSGHNKCEPTKCGAKPRHCKN